jgi:hypothetical protein
MLPTIPRRSISVEVLLKTSRACPMSVLLMIIYPSCAFDIKLSLIIGRNYKYLQKNNTGGLIKNSPVFRKKKNKN